MEILQHGSDWDMKSLTLTDQKSDKMFEFIPFQNGFQKIKKNEPVVITANSKLIFFIFTFPIVTLRHSNCMFIHTVYFRMLVTYFR